MRFHVHCVMEPNQIRRCLTVDSALDTHISGKKKVCSDTPRELRSVSADPSVLIFPFFFFFFFPEKTAFKPAEFPKRAANSKLKTQF